MTSYINKQILDKMHDKRKDVRGYHIFIIF